MLMKEDGNNRHQGKERIEPLCLSLFPARLHALLVHTYTWAKVGRNWLTFYVPPLQTSLATWQKLQVHHNDIKFYRPSRHDQLNRRHVHHSAGENATEGEREKTRPEL